MDPVAERSIRESRPIWSFRLVDAGGSWCWGHVDPGHIVSALKTLASYETMRWGEIEAKKSCGLIEVSALCSEAQKRLQEIGQADADTLFKFRVTGARRVWGIRRGSTFEILWWDPEHSVYPMNLADN